MKKKQERGILEDFMVPTATSLKASMASPLIQPMASSLINAISGKGVIRTGKEQEGRFLSL